MPTGICAGAASHPLCDAPRCSQADSSAVVHLPPSRTGSVIFPEIPDGLASSSSAAADRSLSLQHPSPLSDCTCYSLYHSPACFIAAACCICTCPLAGGILCRLPDRNCTRISVHCRLQIRRMPGSKRVHHVTQNTPHASHRHGTGLLPSYPSVLTHPF